MRDGSFWSKSNLPLAKLLELAMAWANNMLVAEAEVWCEVSEKSVLQWFQFFRDVCSHELTTNPIQIGGPGVVVWALYILKIFQKMRMSEKWHNNNNSDNPLTSYRTDGCKKHRYDLACIYMSFCF